MYQLGHRSLEVKDVEVIIKSWEMDSYCLIEHVNIIIIGTFVLT